MNEFDLIDQFLAEAKDSMSDLDSCLNQINDPALASKAIDTSFRKIHTLKGCSGFLGLQNITDLTHSMEGLLDELRSGRMKPEPQIVNVLILAQDRLAQLIEHIHDSNSMDISSVLSQLEQALSKEISPQETEDRTLAAEPHSMANHFVLDPDLLASLPVDYSFFYLIHQNQDESEPYPPDLLSIAVILASSSTFKAGATILLLASRLDPGCFELVIDPDKITFTPVDEPFWENNFLQPTTSSLEEVPPEILSPLPQDIPTPVATNKTNAKEYVRVPVDILDRLMALAGELVLIRNQQLSLSNELNQSQKNATKRLDLVTTDLQETIMKTRMQPLEPLFSRMKRMVRELSRQLNKEIQLESAGGDVELDKAMLEVLVEPLTHMIRNSCDHGIEKKEIRQKMGKNPVGQLYLKAWHEGGQIHLSLIDDGKGISTERIKSKALETGLKNEYELSRMNREEVLNLILLPGFSTASEVSEISGRGVGMDVVKSQIQKLGGELDLESVEEVSTTIHMRLPLTLAIIPCLIVKSMEHFLALPQVSVEELVRLYDEDVKERIEVMAGQEVVRLREQLIPLFRMNEILIDPQPLGRERLTQISNHYRDHEHRNSLNLVILKVGGRKFGCIVDQILGFEEIVVKPIHSTLKHLNIYSGSTVMGDGTVALILDALGLARHCSIQFEKASVLEELTISADRQKEANQYLLFKYGPEENLAVELKAVRRIERIKENAIQKIGPDEFITVENKTYRIVRPDSYLNLSSPQQKQNWHLILPKNEELRIGLLSSQILDIVSTDQIPDYETLNNNRIKGTIRIGESIIVCLNLQEGMAA